MGLLHYSWGEPKHITAVDGGNVTFKFDLETSKPPAVSWLDFVHNLDRNPLTIFTISGGEVSPPTSEHYKLESDYSLSILRCKVHEDAGEYIATSELDGNKSVNQTFVLSVAGLFPCCSLANAVFSIIFSCYNIVYVFGCFSRHYSIFVIVF